MAQSQDVEAWSRPAWLNGESRLKSLAKGLRTFFFSVLSFCLKVGSFCRQRNETLQATYCESGQYSSIGGEVEK